MRIELTTYALRVRSVWRQAESRRDTSATVMGFPHFSGVGWSDTDASGLTTELTTLGDIQRSANCTRTHSEVSAAQSQYSQVIYTARVPRVSGAFPNSSAAVPPKWVTIFVGQTWINTLASHFGLHLQSSESWTCLPTSVTGPAARSFEKQLSSTLLHDSDPLNPEMFLDVDEYLLGGIL